MVDIYSLHRKVDGLMKRLAIVEKSIHSRVTSRKQITRAKRRDKHLNLEDDEAPPWVEPLMRSFDELKQFAQQIQDDAHAIKLQNTEEGSDLGLASQRQQQGGSSATCGTSETTTIRDGGSSTVSVIRNELEVSHAIPDDSSHDQGTPDTEVLGEEPRSPPVTDRDTDAGIVNTPQLSRGLKGSDKGLYIDTGNHHTGALSTGFSRALTTETDAAATNNIDIAPNSFPVFKLSETDMGEALVSKLETIIDRDDFRNEILVPEPSIDWSMFEGALNINTDDCQYVAEKYTAGPENEGYSFIHVLDHKHHFKFPDFAEQARIPSTEEARLWLDNVIQHPPEDIISYYCGHAFGVPFKSPLNPGREILDDPKLMDIHKPYTHIGGDKSAARTHWEDLSHIGTTGRRYGLRSANLVLAGVKIWILIATHHTTKFRDFVNANWPLGPCDYGVSHQNLLISPSRLEREGIDFTIHIGCPGKLIVTHQCQYHLVINMGPCIAQSINFKLSADRLICREQVLCSLDGLADYATHHGVPLFSLTRSSENAPHASMRSSLRRKRKNSNKKSSWDDAVPIDETRRTKQRRTEPPNSTSLEGLHQLAKTFSNGELVFKIPGLNKTQLPSERVFRLVCAISSRETLQIFSSVVESWNKRGEILKPAFQDQDSPINRRGVMLQTCTRGNDLMKYLSRHHQLYLLKDIEAHKKGRIRTDSSYKQALLTRTGWTNKNYAYHMSKGKKWMDLCAISEGLLPFVPLSSNSFGVKIQECFNEQELEGIRCLLDDHYLKALFCAGLAFQQAIEASRSVKFAWDGSVVDWGSLEEAEAMSYFQVVDARATNLVD
ncbi:unnamed protein product [Fusarium langsethiae]|nr:unnamed protein product [Fusarium langsethiae]